mgnify:CR=1 FL=1
MKQITLTKNNTFEHVWIKGLHSIPDKVISVTDEVFHDLAQNPHIRKYDPISKVVSDYIPEFSFTDAYGIKQAEIDSAANQAFNLITNSYLPYEIDTFKTQEEEANAWRDDNTALTPTLDGIIANRPSVTKAVLVDKILDVNAPAYKAVSGAVMGKKQHFEDLIEALDSATATQADFDAIVVDFS